MIALTAGEDIGGALNNGTWSTGPWARVGEHTLDVQSIGLRTVPSAVFEADTPQTISIDVDYDLSDPVGGQVHASESYSLTIQRVNEDGSPL